MEGDDVVEGRGKGGVGWVNRGRRVWEGSRRGEDCICRGGRGED